MTSPMRKPTHGLGSGFRQLEDRAMPHTAFGIPWADPGHLTLSFAPDGTATPVGPRRPVPDPGRAGTPALAA